MPRMANPNFLPLTPAELKAAFQEHSWSTRFPPVLSVEQAAELLQVPKGTIYDWRKGLVRQLPGQRETAPTVAQDPHQAGSPAPRPADRGRTGPRRSAGHANSRHHRSGDRGLHGLA